MKIKVIAVGTLKEKFYREACNEYLKRLRPMVRFEMQEISEETIETKGQEALIKRVLEREGQRILKSIPNQALVVPLTLQGKQLDSKTFAEVMDPKQLNVNEIIFIIGGSYGLDRSVIERATWCLNFGPMTFPHQLARVMLLEQIYRGQMILAGRTYHK